MQHSLVQDRVVSGPVVLREQRLPGEPCIYPLLQFMCAERGYLGLQQGTGVRLSLQQARNRPGLIDADRCGFGFQPDEGRIRQVVVLPPAALFSLPGKFRQARALRWIRDVIKVAQVANVPRAGAALPGLDTAELGEENSSRSFTLPRSARDR